ncbi:MAG: hypothetical protein R3D28_21255 [Geminicoccaceae bacterium]
MKSERGLLAGVVWLSIAAEKEVTVQAGGSSSFMPTALHRVVEILVGGVNWSPGTSLGVPVEVVTRRSAKSSSWPLDQLGVRFAEGASVSGACRRWRIQRCHLDRRELLRLLLVEQERRQVRLLPHRPSDSPAP